MNFTVEFNGFHDIDALDNIREKLADIDSSKSYNIVIEYNNLIVEEQILSENYMLEIKPEHLRYLRKLRTTLEDADINVKKIYLLGSLDKSLLSSLRVAAEPTVDSEESKNIMWPSKELYLYDGGKQILDDLLENEEIDVDEYEAKLKLLQIEFGLLDFLEKESYIN
ncbi:hypothetical protein SAMN02745751_00788 [Dethiosulfatibacter aminovorans DSM 17477]|uniref:Uncharacterized protein n=1 Tax=Dethiosulfatibacter aminovorans DSM 17477 TaxID=1121476 RepID=A0A1M6D5B9_9FIRM|nr:hypothetical protein [Dethiosulfatibacter aminovorans]SHI68455.1 hypothetical protein SAMN02745751_00788 [Dethiosulfatibacter aminovorans DSM 17477]